MKRSRMKRMEMEPSRYKNFSKYYMCIIKKLMNSFENFQMNSQSISYTRTNETHV